MKYTSNAVVVFAEQVTTGGKLPDGVTHGGADYYTMLSFYGRAQMASGDYVITEVLGGEDTAPTTRRYPMRREIFETLFAKA